MTGEFLLKLHCDAQTTVANNAVRISSKTLALQMLASI